MASRRAVTAARRLPFSGALAATAATAATAVRSRDKKRAAATAARSRWNRGLRTRAQRIRAARAAMLLGDLAATAATAATVSRLMAATRLVAMAATELWSVLITTSRFWTYGIAGQRQAVTVAWHLPVTGAMAAMAATAALAATRPRTGRKAATAVMPV